MADDEVDGAQIKIITQAVTDAFERYERGHPTLSPPVLAISERDVRKIVREENERSLAPIKEQIAGFVESKEIDKRINGAIVDGFKAIGLYIDEKRIEETALRVRGVLETQKLIDQVWRMIRLSMILAAAGAVFHMLGLHVPLVGMEGH